MTLAAYTPTPDFAYPGWRLRIPGGPAGGHYKGFTHNYSTSAIEAQDEFEADRNAGAASHDVAHASPRSPRGVYRGPAEVPPRPNASGNAIQTYQGGQLQRHPGISIAPGSFPAPFSETPEDAFLAQHPEAHGMDGLGFQMWDPTIPFHELPGTDMVIHGHGSGATNVVAIPAVPDQVLPPNDSVVDWTIPPVSPRPGPTVAAPADAFMPAHQTSMIPSWNVQVGPGGVVTANVGTAPSSFTQWMDDETIWPGVANKWVAGGALALFVWIRRGRR